MIFIILLICADSLIKPIFKNIIKTSLKDLKFYSLGINYTFYFSR